MATKGAASLLAASDLSVCIAVLLIAAAFLIKRAVRNTVVVQPHNSMILTTEHMTDARMLAAQREAKRGFTACVSCGFTNFAHVLRCALCGLLSSDSKLPASVLPFLNEDVALPRTLKRREWTRELDAHNRLVWHRRLAEGGDCSPGYVLRFALPPETEPEAEREVSKQRQRSLSTGYDPCAGVQFELLEPRDVDPTQFPLPPPRVDLSDALEDLKHVAVELSAQDFPTKYAHFAASAATLLQTVDDSARSYLSVHRDFILEQSVQHINCIREDDIRSVRLQVSFADQGDVSSDGKEVGGLHRGWLTLLIEKLVDPDVGLFSCTQRSDQTFFINSQSKRVLGEDHLQHFNAAGRLIGRALLEGAVLNFHLCVPLLKMILGTPITFGDLEFLDAEMYRNLTWLLDNDGAESLELDFTVTQRHGNHAQIVELIPAGRKIQVNDDNKFEFADRKFRFMMFESVAPQLSSFLKGFYDVVPQRMLLPFDYEELDYLLCGSDEISVSDWQLHTHLALEPRQEVTWFWDVVKEMSQVYQKSLLQFTTGYSHVPLVGFQGLTNYDGQLSQFTLTDASGLAYFRSHACYNTLELPHFKTRDDLRAALYAALYNESSVNEFKA
ncbi:Ubiquitin-transferase HECT domain-containing protein [Phytophthora infestans]|uniref:HECT-type E3 ubiquitin transferase n=1 Tax=Phytophthora infestans TaxID=4787 RepID=A0A8S9UE12_PHYIN|nr:Ubiquitin-transferase HECT domain-containing protein [Phytophthora infestans]